MALKLNLNALKNLNWKEVMLQHGDKIALIATGAIGLLLLVWTLFLPGGGLWLLTSPGRNASALKQEFEVVERGLSSNSPGPNDKPAQEKPRLEDLSNFQVKDPKAYLVAHLFDMPLQAGSTRKQPGVKLPDGALATAMLGQIRTYIFTPDNEKVLVLQGAVDKNAKNSGQDIQQLQNATGRKPGGKGPGGRQASPGNQPQNLRAPGTQAAPEDRKIYKGNYVALVDLENTTGGNMALKLATTPRPLPMTEIVASFPLKKQMDEFKDKLRLPSYDAVLNEPSTETDDSTSPPQPLPAFRFLGVRLQRRVVDAAGKPLSNKNDGWEDIDLAKDYRPYLFATGKKFETELHDVLAVSVPGLVMPRLVQAREHQYPEIETKLENITKTLEEIAKANREQGPRPVKPQAFDVGGLDIFQGQAGATGSGEQQPRGPMPGRPNPPRMSGPGELNNQLAAEPPTHCLIRVIDVTIKPGTIYEYRMQVRLANPNFGRKNDVASPEYAEGKELVSEEWYVVPQKVVVPPEMVYYAVDQKDLENRVDNKNNYTGLNARETLYKDRQVAFQIQRWVETIDSPKAFLGEWAVAERIIVNRGEYIGRTVRVEVPVWNPYLDGFDIPHTEKGRQKLAGVEVHFGDPRNEAILVDFDGPDHEYKTTAGKPVREHTTTEVVIFSSDGKLLARDSKNDEKNAARQDKLKEWRSRVKEVKEGSKPAGDPKTGSPFGGPSGK